MDPYNEEEHLRRITADIASLEKRIQRQLSDIEGSQLDGLDMATAMKRLFVLDEYRAALLEDRRLVIQRMS